MQTPAFLFDDVRISPDRQIGWHSHARWELSYVICGGGMRTIGDFTEPIVQGEIILIPPHIPHVWNFDPKITDEDGNIANISVFFEAHTLRSLRHIAPELSDALDQLESQTQALYYIGESYNVILNLLLSMRGLTPQCRFPRMMELLIAIADISESRGAGKNNTLSRTERRLEQVRIYCACNYMRPISLDELSRHVGMNKSSFCTFMRRHTGLSPSEYVNQMRLERAKEKLIQTDYTISEIAADCGFQTVTYFNRLFRARYGYPPSSLRS